LRLCLDYSRGSGRRGCYRWFPFTFTFERVSFGNTFGDAFEHAFGDSFENSRHAFRNSRHAARSLFGAELRVHDSSAAVHDSATTVFRPVCYRSMGFNRMYIP
jgi:hypothetical protein